MSTDPRVDAYIARQADFAQPILNWCRARVHAVCSDVEESIKWSMPAFSYNGRPLAGMAGFKHHASFGFWRREKLATGREGEAMGQFGKLSSIDDLPDAAAFDDLLRAAVALIDSGEDAMKRARRPPKPEADVPPALAAALSEDDTAAATFQAFPPGCRREYCEWIGEAKRPETRDKRVAEAIGWLREGKKRNWKYENC